MRPDMNAWDLQQKMIWDPKNLEIKTLSVEKTLEPLVIQVTTLVNTKGPSKKKKGRSKRAQILVAAVEKATSNFIQIGELIANENPDNRTDLMAAVDEVKMTGEPMSVAAREFAQDPCSSVKRGNMVKASRNLLSAVTRLLILADMVDVHRLLKSINMVKNELELIRNASNQIQVDEAHRRFKINTDDLINQAAKRQNELKDIRLRDDLAAARAVLKKNSMLLLTASKVFVRHPELKAAQENRDFIYKQICEAVETINDIAHGKTGQQTPFDGPGELAAAIDYFDECIIMDPMSYNEVRTRPLLEEQLESIISGAALMADGSCTRETRRTQIVIECNAVRQALQDLLTEYMANAGQPTNSESLDQAINHITRKTRDLRRQLRQAVVDHVSDSFLETNVPLKMLIHAAKAGDEIRLKECSDVFEAHARKLVDVACNVVCSMSSNEDGVKMVKYAAAQIDNLYPQVIHAATILAARPKSKPALENMEAFEEAWGRQVGVLIEAVDDITTIDDFLVVSEHHILDDVRECMYALENGMYDQLDQMAGAIRGRSTRVCNVVTAEMDNYEKGDYTMRVLQAVKELRESTDKFAVCVGTTIDLMQNGIAPDQNEFIYASHDVHESVREIRRAVLSNRTFEELDSEGDIEYEDNTYETRSKSSAHTDFDEYPDVQGITNTRDAYRLISEEEKQKIAAQVEVFNTEKKSFEREVAKWDDKGNDIIVIAKSMCMIMMEMTDFTRGKGPLKTTMDVINAAKKISEHGTRLDKLAKQIAEECPESTTKNDLLAYLNRITLHCHQLNITSKVKADVQNISGNLIVSGLDSATSLIQAAKNLMNAVVLTVKSSYVASTKYPGRGGNASSIVVWKMKVPEKKSLVIREKPEEVRAKVRRASQKKAVAPLKALSEFQSPADSV